MVLRINVVLLTSYIGGLFFFSRKKEPSEMKKNIDNVEPSIICKFVLDGSGKKLGESVSVADDVLIIKSGSLFLGVPMKHVESVDKTLVVKGIFDFTKAYELGEKWRKESYREMNQHDHPEEKSKRF
jgi:uncharacterized protein YneF (UPF0154 family)